MTTESTEPAYTLATHAPWREILRQRWSGRRDRALVLRGRDGRHHVLWPRRRHSVEQASFSAGYGDDDQVTVVRETATALRLRGDHECAFHVPLAEHQATRAVRLPDEYGPEPVNVRVLWWVHDPAQVVRTQTGYGWDAVRKDLDRRLRELEHAYASAQQPLRAADVAQQLALPQELPECGLTYRVTDVRARDADGELLLVPSAGGGFPDVWNANRREEYDFCLQAVRSGPASLAALWLMLHPNQVPDVLTWVAGNQSLVREEPNWQGEMAGLLGKLTEQEQLELSKILRDRLVSLGRRVPTQKESPVGATGPGGHGRPAGAPNGRPV
ncbi:hypothetical protein ACWIG3_03505 [Streptomyces celluloflavus]